MQALNVEDNTEGLRYEKVILATDATLPDNPSRSAPGPTQSPATVAPHYTSAEVFCRSIGARS